MILTLPTAVLLAMNASAGNSNHTISRGACPFGPPTVKDISDTILQQKESPKSDDTGETAWRPYPQAPYD